MDDDGHRPPTELRESDGHGLISDCVRLLELHTELALSEVREQARSAAIDVGIALAAAMALIASSVVLIAATCSALLGADWRPLAIAGAAVGVVALVALTLSVRRLRNLTWPTRGLTSLRGTVQWLAVRLKSRLTSI